MQAWTALGSTGYFSLYTARTISLVLHPTTGAPYVAYKDGNGNLVRTFTNGAWSTVGGPFATGTADFISLKLHPTTGAPTIAFQDAYPIDGLWLNTAKASVMTYNGSAWSFVGARGFSAAQAEIPSLALHPTTGAPYVAYQDVGNGRKTTVMTYTGGSWSPVGKAGFSGGAIQYTSLALHPTTGVPYVAYSDQSTPDPGYQGILMVVG